MRCGRYVVVGAQKSSHGQDNLTSDFGNLISIATKQLKICDAPPIQIHNT